MTHEEAIACCVERNRSDDRRWMVRQAADGTWHPVRTNLANRSPVRASTAENAQTPPALGDGSLVEGMITDTRWASAQDGITRVPPH